jgi:hypothetical protein
LKLIEEKRGDEIARQSKEDIDAEEAPVRPVQTGVKENDCDNGKCPNAV